MTPAPPCQVLPYGPHSHPAAGECGLASGHAGPHSWEALPAVDCAHPEEPHTVWWWDDWSNSGPPVPSMLKLDDLADALAVAYKAVRQAQAGEYDTLVWIKVFRTGNEAYTCMRWDKPERAEPVEEWGSSPWDTGHPAPRWWERTGAIFVVGVVLMAVFFLGYVLGSL